MATIYEVAAHAEVSPATVSRVMNGTAVRPELEERVRIAIAALNYRPSRRARSLRTNHSEMIALVIPDIENPFFTALARGAEHVTRKAGYSLVLCNTDDDSALEEAYVEVIQAEHMTGAIVAPYATGAAFLPLLNEGRPIVAVDRHIEDGRADAVMVDNVTGAMEASQWLFDQGRTRVACITGQQYVQTARERAHGWRKVVDAHGGAPEDYLVWTNFHVEGGMAAMEDLLDRADPPDGIVAANNLVGIGALTALARRGLTAIDIAVSVCDSLPHIIAPVPGVHTVHTPARAIGEHAATLLLARIEGDKSPARNVVLNSRGDVISSAPHPPSPPSA